MSKSLGTLKVLITGDSRKLQKALTNTENRLKRSARKWKSYGSAMTSAFTIPAALIGAASVKLATDLETNFAKIENLVGISGDKLQGFKSAVSSISGEVGQSQNKLSEALFTVTSAGLRGAEAIEVLRQSAKASAIGMGETAEVARAATGVIQAYGKDNISAARAVDVMTTTVREGNLAASDLAPVLGRVTGLAATMGVSFEEVGANIATFTRLGVGAEEAVTALRGTLNTFLKATPETRKALLSVGLSLDGIRKKIKNDGLAETLVLLMKKFKGNQDGLAKLIPNVRALSGVLGVAGQQSEKYLEIVKNITVQNGIVDEGFKRVSQTAGFKFKAALVQLQNAGIQLGNILIPYVVKAVNAVSGLIAKFQALSPETKKTVVRFGLIAAAIGPVVYAVGALKGAFAGLIGVVKYVIPAIAKSMTVLTGPVGIAVAALVAGAVLVYKNWDAVKTRIVNVTNYFIDLYNESALFRGVIEGIVFQFKTLWNVTKAWANVLFESFKGLGKGFVAFMKRDMDGVADIFKETATNISDIGKDMFDTIKKDGEDLIENIFQPRKKINPISESDIDNSLKPILDYAKSVKKQVTGIFSGGAGGGTSTTATDTTTTPTATSDFTPDFNTDHWIKLNQLQVSTIGLNDKMKASFKKMGGTIKTVMSEGLTKAEEYHNTITAGAQRMVNDGLMVAAEGFTNMFAAMVTGGDVGSAFKGLLNGLVGVLQNFAKLAITTGIAALGIKKALQLNPAAAIAGGVALLALTQIVKSSLANMNKEVPGYAAGGIFSGESLIRVGEYAGASSNPEVVAPLNKLEDMLKLNGGGGNMQLAISIDSNLRGYDIMQTINKNKTRYTRSR